MKMKYAVILLILFNACISGGKIDQANNNEKVKNLNEENGQYQTAYFASGCFWCVEAVYESVEGVVEAYSGYSGGHVKNPTYQIIGGGMSGHAETVKLVYDEKKVGFEDLVKVFFGSGDPTTLNQQGPDRGTQYRSIIFYQSEVERNIALKVKHDLEAKRIFDNPIITEITAFEKFWIAEDYHQDYEKLNPNNPYVRSVSIPRLNRFKAKFPELLK